MTKVKTILAEFCSAKDILAINRLGLLKKEEREAQPIPWRHRLPIKERRELVRSELRMSTRPQSHSRRKDVARALSSASCPRDSKMGEYLLSSQSKTSTILVPRLGRISNEQRRTECQLQQMKKTFLRRSTCLNHEPLILVKRPASPKVKSRASFIEKHGMDPTIMNMPSYRRPIKSQCRTPSIITTIEAFQVETKKKKNIWEEAVEDREERKFKSTAKPSARLTEYEKKQLKVGYLLHKPTQESIASLGEDDENDDVILPVSLASKDNKSLAKDGHQSFARGYRDFPEDSIAGSSAFVTQMYGREREKAGKGQGRLKTVSFADIGETNTNRSRRGKNLLLLQSDGKTLKRPTKPEASSPSAVCSTGPKPSTSRGPNLQFHGGKTFNFTGPKPSIPRGPNLEFHGDQTFNSTGPKPSTPREQSLHLHEGKPSSTSKKGCQAGPKTRAVKKSTSSSFLKLIVNDDLD